MPIRIQDLHTFYVAAKAQSMRVAAEQLHVTSGAISQRVRFVEEQYGKRLFVRSRTGLTLTKAGQGLWDDLNRPFSAIQTAADRHFCPSDQHHIRISTTVSFAASYLVPQLDDFSEQYPAVNLSISTDNRLVDFHNDPVDIALRHGLGVYPGLESQHICSPQLTVVCSPELVQSGAAIHTAADCLHYPLLRNIDSSDWELWFEAQNIDHSSAKFRHSYSDDVLAVKAAVSGFGLALVSDVYVASELESNLLVTAFEGAWPTRFAYYAVAPSQTFENPTVVQLVDWLKGLTTVEPRG